MGLAEELKFVTDLMTPTSLLRDADDTPQKEYPILFSAAAVVDRLIPNPDDQIPDPWHPLAKVTKKSDAKGPLARAWKEAIVNPELGFAQKCERILVDALVFFGPQGTDVDRLLYRWGFREEINDPKTGLPRKAPDLRTTIDQVAQEKGDPLEARLVEYFQGEIRRQVDARRNGSRRTFGVRREALGETPPWHLGLTLARYPCKRYIPDVMIASFADGATADLFHGVDSARSRRWSAIGKLARRKLDMVNAAAKLDDLKAPPGNRLEALKGDLAGQHSIRINDQWRVVFNWKDGAAHEVKITDYH